MSAKAFGLLTLAFFLGFELVACVVHAQTKTYTNADLSHGQVQWKMPPPSPEILAGLERREFRLAPEWGQGIDRPATYDRYWPFTAPPESLWLRFPSLNRPYYSQRYDMVYSPDSLVYGQQQKIRRHR